MNSKNIFFTFVFSLIFIFIWIPLQAAPQWQTIRIEIKITPQKPPSYQGTNSQFLANPVYMQGEKAVFDIAFRELPSMWFLWSRYIDIPQQNLLTTFPNQKTNIMLKHISTGHYRYISPELAKAGSRNHTLSVSVIIPPSILNRRLQIIATNKCSISVARLPLNIRITSPTNGALLNTNPLNVTGTVDDNRAVVTVNNRSAVVQNNQFTAQISVIEGQNNITARARNRFGTTAQDLITVTIDTIPPQNPSIRIQQGQYTNNLNINLILSAVDANEMIISENQNFVGTNWEPYQINKQLNLSNRDGGKTIYVKFKDWCRNETQAISSSIILDTTPPLIQIDYPENNLLSNQSEINISGRFTDANINTITVNNIPAAINNNTFSAQHISLSNEGNNSITVTATDLAGNTNSVSVIIIKDTIPPQNPSISIQQGEYTNNPNITLTLSAQDAAEMVISEDPQFANPQWILYANTKSFTLSQGDGNKTVYVKYRDLAHNETQAVGNSIILDTMPPQNPSLSIQEGNRTNTRTIHLILLAEGASEMLVSENQNFTGAVWEPYVQTKEYTLSQGDGLKYIYVKFRDRASNETGILQDRIMLGHVISITSPTNGLTINASWATVSGTVTNIEGIKIYINGLPAKITNNTFCLNQLPLAVGTNRITAQAYLNDELLEGISINIFVNQLIDPIQITASPLSGEPSLQVNFAVTTNIQNPITKYEWDFDNDGIFDWQSQQTGDTSHTYTETRIYNPTIKITDNNQIQYSASIPINVYLERQLQWSVNVQDPIDIAVDSQRNLYVLQRANEQIQKYDKDGNLIDTIGSEGQLSGQFNNPCGIALDQAGNIYIADTGNNRIQKLTQFGLPDDTFGTDGVIGINADNDNDGILDSGTENSQFNQPYGIAVDNEGNIYVSDTGNNRIQSFSQNGEFILKWDVQSPYGISVETLGDIYIACKNNNQILIFTQTGSSEGTYSSANLPTDIIISNNYIYIADTGNNKIQKIDKGTLQFISAMDSFNNNGNRENLTNPIAVALDTDLQKELIYIAETGNNRIIKIELPITRPETTWNNMITRLRQGNINSAVFYFTENSIEKYRELFTIADQQGKLPQVINDLENIQCIYIEDNTAEYVIKNQINGQELSFFVYFDKDENGEWKIRQF